MTEKILVALDFSKVGEAVARYGQKLGHSAGTEVTFVHVVPDSNLMLYDYTSNIRDLLLKQQEEAKKAAKEKLKQLLTHGGSADYKQVILEGDPTEAILDHVKENKYTMLILGYKGHSVMERLLIGSTVNKIVAHAPCSVLVYRPLPEELK